MQAQSTAAANVRARARPSPETRTMARLAHAQESAGSSGGQDGVQAICWARRKYGRASRKRTNAPTCSALGTSAQSMDLQGNGRGLTGSRGDIPRPTAEASRRLMRDCVLQEEDAATQRAEAKRAELGKISKELFGNGHPPGGRRA